MRVLLMARVSIHMVDIIGTRTVEPIGPPI
jgi:hypothetical protein